jgi:hypothetical protein
MILEALETIEIPHPDELRGRLSVAARQVRILKGLLKISVRNHPEEDPKARIHAGAETASERSEATCAP